MRIKGVLLLSGLLLLGGMLLASDYDKRTVITFNEPVMIAGVPVVTLEPGQYVIKLVNHAHNRNIVQVFNERENKLFTTVLAIPNYRLFPRTRRRSISGRRRGAIRSLSEHGSRQGIIGGSRLSLWK